MTAQTTRPRTPPEPASPSLPGIEPAPQRTPAPVHTAHATRLPYLALIGLLDHAPRIYTPTHGTVQLDLLIRQHDDAHPHALPVLVQQRWSVAESSAARAIEQAHLAAHGMHAGARVVVRGFGLEYIKAHPAHGRVLRMVTVDETVLYDELERRMLAPQQ